MSKTADARREVAPGGSGPCHTFLFFEKDRQGPPFQRKGKYCNGPSQCVQLIPNNILKNKNLII